MNQRALSNDVIRRRLLMAAAGVASVAMLPACGGGGGGGGDPSPTPPPPTGGPTPPPPPPPPPAPPPVGTPPPSPPPPAPPPPGAWSPTGTLVYRNSSQIGIWDFASDRERVIAPGSKTFPDPGIGAQRGGALFTFLQDQRVGWDIVLVDRSGVERDRFEIRNEYAIPGSVASLSPDGTRVLFGMSDHRSSSDSTYVDRVLLARLSDGMVLSAIDGYMHPSFFGTDGGFVAVNARTLALHRFSAQGTPLGAIPTLSIEETRASYDASPDGRSIAYVADGIVRLRDVATGADRQLVRSNNGLHIDSPLFSPDGRGLAVMDKSITSLVAYVVEIPASGSVTLNEGMRIGDQDVVELYGHMGWIG